MSENTEIRETVLEPKKKRAPKSNQQKPYKKQLYEEVGEQRIQNERLKSKIEVLGQPEYSSKKQHIYVNDNTYEIQQLQNEIQNLKCFVQDKFKTQKTKIRGEIEQVKIMTLEEQKRGRKEQPQEIVEKPTQKPALQTVQEMPKASQSCEKKNENSRLNLLLKRVGK